MSPAVRRCMTHPGPIVAERNGWEKKNPPEVEFRRICGADGNRNHDLFDANEALYQLSYSPMVCCHAPQDNSYHVSTFIQSTQPDTPNRRFAFHMPGPLPGSAASSIGHSMKTRSPAGIRKDPTGLHTHAPDVQPSSSPTGQPTSRRTNATPASCRTSP